MVNRGYTNIAVIIITYSICLFVELLFIGFWSDHFSGMEEGKENNSNTAENKIEVTPSSETQRTAACKETKVDNEYTDCSEVNESKYLSLSQVNQLFANLFLKIVFYCSY